MKQSTFSGSQQRQAEFALEQVSISCYGIVPLWMGQSAIEAVRHDLETEFSPRVAFYPIDYRDVGDLPPVTRAHAKSLGAIARRGGLTPRQIGIAVQSPRELGPEHFDINTSISYITPVDRTELDLIRPNVDGVPNMQDDGSLTFDDSHLLTVPGGSLVVLGGDRFDMAALHRVRNPNDYIRYSFTLACQ